MTTVLATTHSSFNKISKTPIENKAATPGTTPVNTRVTSSRESNSSISNSEQCDDSMTDGKNIANEEMGNRGLDQ